ncbi:hypothetical protein COCON_G00230650 [Conger conger]|uniref:Uncharacterized protein n=1 Tax=Conger conger TaxID=82655 RepID=A0A9Q1CVF9_CONCO|nr:hypothetical protein COCON_G00230650 [Conger conger]
MSWFFAVERIDGIIAGALQELLHQARDPPLTVELCVPLELLHQARDPPLTLELCVPQELLHQARDPPLTLELCVPQELLHQARDPPLTLELCVPQELLHQAVDPPLTLELGCSDSPRLARGGCSQQSERTSAVICSGRRRKPRSHLATETFQITSSCPSYGLTQQQTYWLNANIKHTG